MTKKYRYLVLGSGMQGTAGAMFLAKFGDAQDLTMADLDLDKANQACQRLQQLSVSCPLKALQVDASQKNELVKHFKNYDAVLSAVDYSLNILITEAAIEAGVHLCDLGGNTEIALKQQEYSSQAQNKGLSIVPDCGLAPGLGNTLASYGIEQMDRCDSVQIRCGGLPQNPKPPLDYKLVFNIRGLTNEYFGKASVLREGKVTSIDTFTELETLEFPHPIRKCEAFVTTGGTSTAPWSFKDQVREYDYKTIRYPGHFDKMKCMKELGLLDLEPVEINGQPVVPREIFHKKASEALDFPNDPDLVALRVSCTGQKAGERKRISFEMLDFFDNETGFSAMERATGFPAALVLIHAARGECKNGVVPLERALNNKKYLEELQNSDLNIEFRENLETAA